MKTETDAVLVCLNVKNEICKINKNSSSKLNIKNINVVMSLLLSHWKEFKEKMQ